jgi:hypothetical protein
MKEFYPVDAETIGEQYESGNITAIHVVEHSLRKWEGMRRENFERHKLVSPSYKDERWIEHKSPIKLDDSTCSMCHAWFRPDYEDYDADPCARCPLSIVRGHVSCDRVRGDEDFSPFYGALDYGKPEPMIKWLKRALTYVKKHQNAEGIL